jgi:5-methylcytosine-specific restriction endonuclease McrA
MTKQEAGLLGSIISSHLADIAKRERIVKYDTNPSRCAWCGKGLSYKQRHNKYCSHSCAKRSHLSTLELKPKPLLPASPYRRPLEYLQNTPFHELGESSKRKVIFLEQEGRCDKCGLSDWLNQPITLELEHIDGNHDNWLHENLIFLCPNCHSQTPTWRGRNKKGNGVPIATIEGASLRQVLIKRGLSPKGAHYKRLKEELGIGSVDRNGNDPAS